MSGMASGSGAFLAKRLPGCQNLRAIRRQSSMAHSIPLRGVRVHNLRGIDVDIPLRKLTVITGISGAGKSSLAFDTLYAEAQRRYLQSFSAYTRQFLERFDTPDADFIGDLSPAVAVSQRSLSQSPRATVGTVTEIFDYLRLLLARFGSVHCLKCHREVHAHSVADVLSVLEKLPDGTKVSIAFPLQLEADENLSTRLDSLKEEGFVRVQIGDTIHRLDEKGTRTVLEQKRSASPFVLVDRVETGKTAPERLHDSLETAFNRGAGRLALLGDGPTQLFDRRLLCPHCEILYPTPEPGLLHFNDPRGACPVCQGTGLTPKTRQICAACQGTRLSEQTNYLLWNGRSLSQLCQLTLGQLDALFTFRGAVGSPALEAKQASRLHHEQNPLVGSIRSRLGYLLAVELGYLTLHRSAVSLSTGEARRVRLTTALGSNLVNALYVFDEPTAGLHPSDTGKLLAQLLRLRSAGNTLVVVEHDAEIIAAADHVIDLGPGAGEEGGQVLFQGIPPLTRGARTREARSLRKPRPLAHGHIRLSGARCHNLQNLTVDFPLGVLCVVTGVSGAGKNSLVLHSLYAALASRRKIKDQPEAQTRSSSAEPETQLTADGAGQINEVVLMDQDPLARTARSNPATFLKVFDDIRKVFAATIDARIHNFTPGHFSFNHAGGRCETCAGQGSLTVDMQFLADVTMTCPECEGSRFKKEILDVKVRSLSIAEVLNLTAREAFRFFRAHPAIERRLKYLLDVGLDYLRLGQPADTLSGGECQRLKLAGHLASSRKTRCLFLLLEPTVGLHPADVAGLLECFDRLLDTGHSLIVVEHNLDVIGSADYIIDLGPGAGPLGGRVVALGTPEEVAAVAESATGACLRKIMTQSEPEA